LVQLEQLVLLEILERRVLLEQLVLPARQGQPERLVPLDLPEHRVGLAPVERLVPRVPPVLQVQLARLEQPAQRELAVLPVLPGQLELPEQQV
jgi:hypothetical protein